jgi:hypothetical protein
MLDVLFGGDLEASLAWKSFIEASLSIFGHPKPGSGSKFTEKP